MVLWSQMLQSSKIILPQEAFELAQKGRGVVLLDVRTREEYNNELGHVAHSMLIPLQELKQRVSELEPYKLNTIIAICRSGNRSGSAAELLTQHGFMARNMEGGMILWNKEGLPVVREGSPQVGV